MKSVVSTRFRCAVIVVAVAFFGVPVAWSDPCNNKVPDAEHLCQEPYTFCLDYVHITACSEVADCQDVTGLLPNKLVKQCVTGGAGSNCAAGGLTWCTETWACEWDLDFGRCWAAFVCSSSNITYYQTQSCDLPQH